MLIKVKCSNPFSGLTTKKLFAYITETDLFAFYKDYKHECTSSKTSKGGGNAKKAGTA